MSQDEFDLWHMGRALNWPRRSRLRRAESDGRLRAGRARWRRRRRMAPAVRRQPCRNRGTAHRRRSVAWRNRLRHAGTLLPHRQNASLHFRAHRRRNPSRRRRNAGSLSRSRRSRFGRAFRRGHRSRNRVAGGGGPQLERALYQAIDRRAALDNCQMGHVARRQNRHAHRRKPLDHRAGSAANRPPIAWPRRWHSHRPRHRIGRRSAVDRSSARSARCRSNRRRHTGPARFRKPIGSHRARRPGADRRRLGIKPRSIGSGCSTLAAKSSFATAQHRPPGSPPCSTNSAAAG